MGFDVGKNGGIAVISPKGYGVRVMPLAGDDLDIGAIADHVREHKPDIAVVERATAMPKQGVVSMFSFGKSYGILLGVLGALGVRTDIVRPQKWKGVILKGTARDKAAAIAYCRRAYKKANLIPTPRSRVPHDGMADALCIASYGMRTYLTNGL